MERKHTGWWVRSFTSLVELFDSKTKAFVMVLLLSVIVALGWELNRTYKMQASMNETRLRRYEDLIFKRLEDRFQPEVDEMRKNTDSAKAKVDTMAAEIKPVLESVSEAVDKLNKRR